MKKFPSLFSALIAFLGCNVSFAATKALSQGGLVPGVHMPLMETACDGRTYQNYTLGGPVSGENPLLRDIFAGTAIFSMLKGDEEEIQLIFTSPGIATWDAKVPTLQVWNDPALYAFVRGFDGRFFAIYLMKSTDHGRTFSESPGSTIGVAQGNLSRFNLDPDLYNNAYDPTISVDHSTCPPTYRMMAECTDDRTGRVDACESHSQTPMDLSSWTRAFPVVIGDNFSHSGSTGVMLIDNAGSRDRSAVNHYVKWTDVQHANRLVTSKGVQLDSLTTVGYSSAVGSILLDAETVGCTDVWDCNNRDAQDWKKEGDIFYLIYNGANYPDCGNPPAGMSNSWGVSIARAVADPLGVYERLSAPLIMAPRSDVCGVSYPYINVIDGGIYLYYSYYSPGVPWPGKNRTMRVPLKWGKV